MSPIQGQTGVEEVGLHGYVLASDGTPVSGGNVQIRSRTSVIAAAIGSTGRFHFVPSASGLHELHVAAPGFAAYRLNVTVPPSRTVRLPVIRLSPATFYRVRPRSSSGEPVAARLLHRSVDLNGRFVTAFGGPGAEVVADSDGTLTLGPLPRGITTLALDAPAVTLRLSDLYVTGADPLLDAGAVTVDAGATLYVDVVTAVGAPVPAHVVFLEDLRPVSPVPSRVTRTDANGRATFDRLGTGRYRVRTSAVDRCGPARMTVARVVPVPGPGTLLIRIVIGGVATLRLMSSFGTVSNAAVSLSTDPAPSPPLPGLRTTAAELPTPGSMGGTTCSGMTDADGRVAFENFPPGPARLSLRLPNSRFQQRLTIPEAAREIRVTVSNGLMPVLVTNAATKRPVANASVTWTSGGTSIDARTIASGDALLEGIGEAGGALVVEAPGYSRSEAKVSEPPATTFELPLAPVPPSALHARVVTAAGESVPDALVEITPQNPIDTPQLAVTDNRGEVRLSDLPPGGLQVAARADGFVATVVNVPEDARSGITLMLSRGYRANVDVDLPATDESYTVRVINATGAAIDDLLDIASARRVTSRGQLSVGPLAPGRYVIELHNERERRRTPVVITDRDVMVTLR